MKSRLFFTSMRICLATCTLIIGLISCASPIEADFQGTWSWSNETAYFDLTIDTLAATISGYHEAGLMDGSRIDTSIPGDEPTVVGTIQGNQALITITSAYSPDVMYEATLSMIDSNTAEWKVTKPMEGQTYIPMQARLKRRTNALEAETNAQSADYETQLIDEIISDKSITETAISAANVQAITLDIQDSSEGGQVEVYRLGQELKRIQVTRFGERAKLISNYWFDTRGNLELAERTITDLDVSVDEVVGAVETSRWYYRDAVLICARDGQENPILIGDPENNAIIETIKQDSTEYHQLGLTE